MTPRSIGDRWWLRCRIAWSRPHRCRPRLPYFDTGCLVCALFSPPFRQRQYFFYWYRNTLPLVEAIAPRVGGIRLNTIIGDWRLTGVSEIIDALKRCLKSRGITYGKLSGQLGLSEASVKRLFSTGGFTLDRVEQICRLLDMDMFELARLAHNDASTIAELSSTQEQALADNPRLLLVFHLLLSGWDTAQIVAEYDVSRAQCIKLTAELDRLRLIDLRPGDQIRLRTARHVSWRREGPIRRAYQQQVLGEFFGAPFASQGETLRFEAKELSHASREVMRRKLEKLVQEFNELARIDAALNPSERDAIGLVVGLRPYVLSLFTRIKRGKRTAPR